MRTTITVDQNNIALTRKQFSEQLISADSEALLFSNFEKVFTNFHNPRKDYGSNRMFQNDLKKTLQKDSAKPSLQGLLTATQLVMNSWEKDSRPPASPTMSTSIIVATEDMEVRS